MASFRPRLVPRTDRNVVLAQLAKIRYSTQPDRCAEWLSGLAPPGVL